MPDFVSIEDRLQHTPNYVRGQLFVRYTTHAVQALLWGALLVVTPSPYRTSLAVILIGYYKEIGEQSCRWHWTIRNTWTDMNLFGKHWFPEDRWGLIGWISGAILLFIVRLLTGI